MKIAWQTRSQLLFDSLEKNELQSGVNGGNIYDFDAAQALMRKHSLRPYEKAVWLKDNPISYWLKLRSQANADISIIEPSPLVFGTLSKKKKYVAIVHHIDFERIEKSIKHRWFFHRLLKKLKKVDAVVTVSKYWKSYLEKNGCKNVHIIYNSFDVHNYKFNDEQLTSIRKKLGLDTFKPLIHIGNASAEKGVYEVYQALKSMNVQLVMTGGSNKAKDLPVPFFNLSPTDYRILLGSCDAVVAFSSMSEGWNRIAHEAMLCKVPVIGSGLGGMKELLEGGKQLVVRNELEIQDKIEIALNRKVELGGLGYSYASQFNLFYFDKAWNELVEQLG